MTETIAPGPARNNAPDMVTEQGTVISVSGDKAWVLTLRQSACQSCSARHGCGQKALAAMSSGQSRQLRVSNTLDARPGDEVTVAIAPASLLQASFLIYAVPLLVMVIAVAVTGAWLPEAELAAILSAVVGLAAGLLIARRVSHRCPGDYEPVMTARARSSSEASLSSNPTVL